MAMRNKKAFSIIEYALFIAVVIAGLIGIQIYLRGALCGRWKATADVFGHGRQYSEADTVVSGGNVVVDVAQVSTVFSRY